jgi:hypothetical protein
VKIFLQEPHFEQLFPGEPISLHVFLLGAYFLETISQKYDSLLVPLAKTVINKVSAEIFP